MFGEEWLAASIDDLEAAAMRAVLDGETLVHADIRSDNLCLRNGRALIVDWNWACVGHPDIDIAVWLPSLAYEGGPMPWEILPGRADLASLFAGYLCEHAGREAIPQAPHVRRLQLEQGRVALTWAARELGLPPPI
jgi:aminoglycoside phosphotransferase (APT) family kinase protein